MVAAVGYKAIGTLKVIDETQQVTARFQKREFVLELADNPRYPQSVQFQLTGDRCGSLDGLAVGDEVEVEFSLRGRQWTSPKGEVKYFNSLDVWSVQAVGGRATAGAPVRNAPAIAQDDIPLPDEPDERFDDDIPF